MILWLPSHLKRHSKKSCNPLPLLLFHWFVEPSFWQRKTPANEPKNDNKKNWHSKWTIKREFSWVVYSWPFYTSEISYYLIPAIANSWRINALSLQLVGFISSHQLTDKKPLVWLLSVIFCCLPTDRIYFCLDNRVLSVGITLLFAPIASISHSPDRPSYRQSWTR